MKIYCECLAIKRNILPALLNKDENPEKLNCVEKSIENVIPVNWTNFYIQIFRLQFISTKEKIWKDIRTEIFKLLVFRLPKIIFHNIIYRKNNKNSFRDILSFYSEHSRLVARNGKESISFFSYFLNRNERVRGVIMRIIFVILGLQIQRSRGCYGATVCTRSYYILYISFSRFTSHIHLATETHLQN